RRGLPLLRVDETCGAEAADALAVSFHVDVGEDHALGGVDFHPRAAIRDVVFADLVLVAGRHARLVLYLPRPPAEPDEHQPDADVDDVAAVTPAALVDDVAECFEQAF